MPWYFWVIFGFLAVVLFAAILFFVAALKLAGSVAKVALGSAVKNMFDPPK
jgi:hypothetical protein